MNTVNQNHTTEESTMNNTQPTDLLMGFNPEEDVTMNNQVTLSLEDIFASFVAEDISEHVKESLTLTQLKREEELRKVRSRSLKTAAKMVTGVALLEELGEESEIGIAVLSLVVTQRTYLRGKQFKNQANSVSKLEFMKESIKLCHTENTAEVLLAKLNEAIKYLNNYTTNPNEVTYKLLNGEERTRTLVQEYSPSKTDISIGLRDTGLTIIAPKGSVLTPVEGQPLTFLRTSTLTLSLDNLNRNTEEVLRRVQIHNENTLITSLENIKRYTKAPYAFNKGLDTLALLLVLKENNIDVKTLFESANKGQKKLLVLVRKEKHNNLVKTLERLPAPAANFSEKYGRTGVVSPSEALQGYVTPMTTLPCLVEFFKDEAGDIKVRLRENANKTVSRFEKLDNAKVLWKVKTKVFLIDDCTKYNEKLQFATVGGDILVPDNWILSNGPCRVVTAMKFGGVKASTTSFANLDENLRSQDVAVLSSAAFKGGMLAAIGCATGRYDWLPSLKDVALAAEKTEDGIKAVNNNLKGYYSNYLKPFLTTMNITGEVVEGYMIELDLCVTNPYAVDNHKTAEDLSMIEEDAILKATDELVAIMENGEKDAYGLRGYVSRMKAQNPDFSVMEWISAGLKDGNIERKKLKTNVTMQEIQSAFHWFNSDRAEQWVLDLLAEQVANGIDVKKVYAAQYIGGVEKNIEKILEVSDICDQLLSLHEEVGHTIQKDSPVYNKSIIEGLLPLFTVSDDFGWIKLVFPNGEEVDIPAGSILLGDIVKQLQNPNKTFVVTKGLLVNVLDAMKDMFDEHSNFVSTRSKSLVLEMYVQSRLLGKLFGYQETKGYYGVALPLLGNYDTTFCGITNRSRLVGNQGDLYNHVTLSKPPANFDGATATYRMTELDFGNDLLNLAFECAVFVTPKSVMMYLNDFDGDLVRVSVGSSLRMVESLYGKFHGSYFGNEVMSQLQGNKIKPKPSSIVSLPEYHQAVYDAIKAKENVGSYTASSYFYEAMLPNIIGTELKGYTVDSFKLTNEVAHKACAIMKVLIQVEAMDNIKQEGSVVFLTELMKYWELRKLNTFIMDEPEVQYTNKINKLVALLSAFVVNMSMDMDEEEIVTMVEAMTYAAINFNPKLNKGFGLFNARNVNEKAFKEVKESYKTNEYEGHYNYLNCYESVLNGLDQKSMHVFLIKETVKAVNHVLTEGLRIKGTGITGPDAE